MSAIQVGIVGIGRAGWGMHCRELEGRKDTFSIVAAADIDPERVEMMTDRYPSCSGYPSIEELLEDDNVELVSIASPSTFHVDHAVAALESGRYVFLEKPIALTLDQADTLRKHAEKNPGKLFCRHNRRFEPGFVHIQDIIRSGVLGDVYEIKLHRHGYQRRDDWQTIISAGGGQLNNWGPHIMDHALQFLDSPVAENWSDLKKVAAVGDAEDHLKVILKGENGRIVDFEISGGVALKAPEYIIYGTKGSLVSDGSEINIRYLDPAVELPAAKAKLESPPLDNRFGNTETLVWKEETIPVSPSTSVDTDSIWDFLYRAISENEEYPITLEEALEVVKQTCAVKSGTQFEAHPAT